MSSINLKKINDILLDLTSTAEEYAFKEIDICTQKDFWLKSNLGAQKNKKITEKSENDNLSIIVESDSQVYLSYKEKTIKFSNIPNTDFDFLPGKSYKVSFNADITGDLSARLYIIGYDDKEKVQQIIVDLNKPMEIKFDENCKNYRLALRFIGNGSFELKGIKLEPIKLALKNKEIIYNPENYRNPKRVIKKVNEVRIACILDEFSYTSFSKECNMITFTPYNFIDVLEENPPDFLLVESAWKGINGSWEFKIAKYNNQDKTALYNLLNYCKSKGIPTVFWNKEDPIHFEKFIDTAKLFDYVFTTDRNIIPRYIEEVGHNKVYSLPFAAQVKTHNPIKKYNREKGVCFAGSYYGNRHEDRRKDMDNVLYACKKYNLTIYDRNYESTKNDVDSPFRYPETFLENVKGSLPYSQIDRAYKGYDVMLNVNSVKDSPTMFSRRVFEGLASGTPIISTYSKGINNMFEDIIVSDDNEEILLDKIDKLMTDKYYWKKLSLEGIRKIMFNHTYENRIRYILSKLSINIEKSIKIISIITFVNSFNEVEEKVNTFNKLKYDDKELIVIANSSFEKCKECFNNYNSNGIRFYLKDYIVKNYNEISDIVNGEYVCLLNDENVYGEEYITDLISATYYTNANIIGKKSYYYVSMENKNKKKGKIKGKDCKKDIGIKLLNKESEYMYVDSLKIDRCILETKFLSVISLEELFNMFKNNSDTFNLFKLGLTTFSIDNNNFIENGSKLNNIENMQDKVFI